MKSATVLAVLGGVNAYTPDALADQVTALPGTENLDINFNHFSGYLTVKDTKEMHYWYEKTYFF